MRSWLDWFLHLPLCPSGFPRFEKPVERPKHIGRLAQRDLAAAHHLDLSEQRVHLRRGGEHEAVERRALLLEIAGDLDAVAVRLETIDDLVMERLRMGCDEEIIDAALGEHALRALQHLDLEGLDIGMQDVEMLDLPVPEEGVDLEFALA